MSIFNGLNITSSALSAQRLRMDVISSNMANVETTRGKYVDGEWVPYRRKSVVFQEQQPSFRNRLDKAMGKSSPGNGVMVSKIREDQSEFKLEYNPSHPDADEYGYVKMPNVDILRETIDYMSTTRSYEANITALNATKSMLIKTLEIGK